MSRHQQQLTLVHKHQQDLESRLRNMASRGSVTRPVATALHEQLAKSSTELDQAERHFRELEQHYFVARTCQVDHTCMPETDGSLCRAHLAAADSTTATTTNPASAF